MIGAIVFARMASTRLPDKVMIKVQGKPILQHVIERVGRAKYVQKVVLATTTNPADDKLEELGRKIGVSVFRGSESDVLDRCYHAAAEFSLDPVVRVTADDPCKDPGIIDNLIKRYMDVEGGYDLVCNTQRPTFPEGLDVEVMSFQALKKAWMEATNAVEREHLTMHMFNNPGMFRILNVENSEDLSRIRLTLDTKEDFEVIRSIYGALYPTKKDFAWTDVVKYLQSRPELLEINKNIKKSGRYQQL